MKNSLKRFLTAVLLGIAVFGTILHSSYSFLGLIMLVNILALLEFYKMSHNIGARPSKSIGLSLGVLIIAISYLVLYKDVGISLFATLLAPLGAMLLFAIFRNNDHKNVTSNLALTVVGVVYISVPLTLSLLIAENNHGVYDPEILIAYIILMSLADIGAYIVGGRFGKRKLARKISPNKTWEGVIGGGIFCVSGGLLMALLGIGIEIVDMLAIALIVIIFGTLGDLTESLLKRKMNVKDSGTILPGHGGMLDRIDGFLGSIPIVYLYLTYMA